jgi:RNA polymerase sigma-70 factor (ECF subfamily)
VVTEQVAGSSKARLADVYERESARLWRALVGFSGDPAIASDAVAEAFAQALARGDEIDSADRWVWKAAFRIAAGELKRRRRDGGEWPDPAAVNEFPEPVDHLVSALRQLSPNQRMAVVLHDYADRPTPEVAAAMGIARATVYVHLSEGRRRLRTLLEDYDA